MKGRKRPGIGGGKPGEQSSAAKLKDGDVCRIRQLLKLGHSQTHIAGQYAVTQEAISRIARRLTWRHLE